MGDNGLIPISDEQAKLIGDFGRYLGDIVGDLPKDLVGLLIGDRVKAKRFERLKILGKETVKRLETRGIDQPEPPSLKLALPIFESAADENSEELQDLWARLLAATMDPNRQASFRQSFIQIVKQMDTFDVLVFQAIRENGGAEWKPNGLESIKAKLHADSDSVRVSFEHLARLGCIRFGGMDEGGPRLNPYMAPFGTLLMNAVSD